MRRKPEYRAAGDWSHIPLPEPSGFEHIQPASRVSLRNIQKISAVERPPSPIPLERQIPDGAVLHYPSCSRCNRGDFVCYGFPGQKCQQCKAVKALCGKFVRTEKTVTAETVTVKQELSDAGSPSEDRSAADDERGQSFSESSLSSPESTPFSMDDEHSGPPAKKRPMIVHSDASLSTLDFRITNVKVALPPSPSDLSSLSSLSDNDMPLKFRITNVPKKILLQPLQYLADRDEWSSQESYEPSEPSTVSLRGESRDVDIDVANDESGSPMSLTKVSNSLKASAVDEASGIAVAAGIARGRQRPNSAKRNPSFVVDFIDVPPSATRGSSKSSTPSLTPSPVLAFGSDLPHLPNDKPNHKRKTRTEVDRLHDPLAPAFLPKNLVGRLRQNNNEELLPLSIIAEAGDNSDDELLLRARPKRRKLTEAEQYWAEGSSNASLSKRTELRTKRKGLRSSTREEEAEPTAKGGHVEDEADTSTLKPSSDSADSSSTASPDLMQLDFVAPVSKDRRSRSLSKRSREVQQLHDALSDSFAPDENTRRRKRKLPARYIDTIGSDNSDEYREDQERPKKKKKTSVSTMAKKVNSLGRVSPDNIASPPKDGYHPQYQRCVANKMFGYPRCKACRGKYFDKDECRFRGVRWIHYENGYPVDYENGYPLGNTSFKSSDQPDPTFHWPVEWNVPVEKEHTVRIKTVIARAMLPEMRKEQAHLQQDGTLQRLRETGCRVTCDACATSLFSGSWMCTQCGRECCLDCYDRMKALATVAGGIPEAGRPLTRDMPRDEQNLLKCGINDIHYPSDFLPCSRFRPDALQQTIDEMESLLDNGASNLTPSEPVVPDVVATVPKLHTPERGPSLDRSAGADAEEPVVAIDLSSHDGMQTPGQATEELVKVKVKQAQDTQENSETTICPEDEDHPIDPAGLGSLPFHRVHYTQIEEPEFRAIWAKGETVVVTGLLSKASIDWSPGYFMEKYGDENCNIVDCDDALGTPTATTVGEFFKLFGRRDRDPGVLKLKDWPPTADFASTFPELYKDFHQIVPIPNYTRRDGALNIASHFPTNAVPPDIGPKMYNAFASSDGPGGHGSTRLHMDMADAVNVLLYAARGADGKEGVAAWDIFRAEDSAKIREFMRAECKEYEFDDPIHSQLFYLDSEMRRKLWETHGVKSWRIYQRAGEAVFIPAGCAHQVCNLADIIKVAVDFISSENVDRCAKLTQEFRAENEKKVWKEDVLALRSTMWYAWQSCSRIESQGAENLDTAQA